MNQVIQVWPFYPLVGTFPTNLSKRYKHKGMSRVPGSDVRIKEVMNGSMGLWLTDPYKCGYIYWGGKKKAPHPKTWWVIPHLQLGIPHFFPNIYTNIYPIYTNHLQLGESYRHWSNHQDLLTSFQQDILKKSRGSPAGRIENSVLVTWEFSPGDGGNHRVGFSLGGRLWKVSEDWFYAKKWFIWRLNN